MADPAIVLTTRDHAILCGMLRQRGDGVAGLPIRHKLATAVVVPQGEVDPDVVTINSRVRFSIDGGPSQERTIVVHHREEVVGMTLLAWTVRGLAMIGMRAGEQARVRRLDGSLEVVTVEAVPYQPEARLLALAAGRAAAAAAPPAPAGAGATLLAAGRPRAGLASDAPWDDGDDPGPAAA